MRHQLPRPESSQSQSSSTSSTPSVRPPGSASHSVLRTLRQITMATKSQPRRTSFVSSTSPSSIIATLDSQSNVSQSDSDGIQPIPLTRDISERMAALISEIRTQPEVTDDDIEHCQDVNVLKQQLFSAQRKNKMLSIHFDLLELQRKLEAQEAQKMDDKKSFITATREEMYKEVVELLESEFSCSICSEVFVSPSVTKCGHTFCELCIATWTKDKPDCPVCRAMICLAWGKHVEMDNFITRLHIRLSDEIRQSREALVQEREKALEKLKTSQQRRSMDTTAARARVLRVLEQYGTVSDRIRARTLTEYQRMQGSPVSLMQEGDIDTVPRIISVSGARPTLAGRLQESPSSPEPEPRSVPMEVEDPNPTLFSFAQVLGTSTAAVAGRARDQVRSEIEREGSPASPLPGPSNSISQGNQSTYPEIPSPPPVSPIYPIPNRHRRLSMLRALGMNTDSETHDWNGSEPHYSTNSSSQSQELNSIPTGSNSTSTTSDANSTETFNIPSSAANAVQAIRSIFSSLDLPSHTSVVSSDAATAAPSSSTSTTLGARPPTSSSFSYFRSFPPAPSPSLVSTISRLRASSSATGSSTIDTSSGLGTSSSSNVGDVEEPTPTPMSAISSASSAILRAFSGKSPRHSSPTTQTQLSSVSNAQTPMVIEPQSSSEVEVVEIDLSDGSGVVAQPSPTTTSSVSGSVDHTLRSISRGSHSIKPGPLSMKRSIISSTNPTSTSAAASAATTILRAIKKSKQNPEPTDTRANTLRAVTRGQQDREERMRRRRIIMIDLEEEHERSRRSPRNRSTSVRTPSASTTASTSSTSTTSTPSEINVQVDTDVQTPSSSIAVVEDGTSQGENPDSTSVSSSVISAGNTSDPDGSPPVADPGALDEEELALIHSIADEIQERYNP